MRAIIHTQLNRMGNAQRSDLPRVFLSIFRLPKQINRAANECDRGIVSVNITLIEVIVIIADWKCLRNSELF